MSTSQESKAPWLPELELTGRVAPWAPPERALLALLVLAGFWLRLRGLSDVGFADDEIHKWLAAHRYLQGNFVGDDIEHPMLMKLLISLCLLIGTPLGWAPEFIVRLPNVVAGSVSIWMVAQLGRRLFGKLAALWAAGLAAFSTTFIGYQRIGKEDTLVGLFLMLLLWCCAEAKAAADDGRPSDQRRYEWLGAASLAAMLASKYFLFFAPIPVLFYVSVIPQSKWRIPFRRWLALTGGSLLVFAVLNWTPFLPSSWEYNLSYFAEKKTIHGALFFMGEIFHNLPSWWLKGTPPWFYLVFAAVKLAPITVLTAAAGLGLALWQRRPAHRLMLSWMGLFFVVLSASGSKWGRFFISVLPGFLLLSAYFCGQLVAWWIRNPARSGLRFARGNPRAVAPGVAVVLITVMLWGGEVQAALRHAPYYRHYINAFGGGDRNLDWFFPHCDYFDAGFREAIAYIAEHAEPNAEVATEIDSAADYYAQRFGRTDLIQTMIRRDQACRGQRTCYVVVQSGRLYFQNQAALRNLEGHLPWHVVTIRGHQVVRVYRLPEGQSPFPDENLAKNALHP